MSQNYVILFHQFKKFSKYEKFLTNTVIFENEEIEFSSFHSKNAIIYIIFQYFYKGVVTFAKSACTD